MSGAKENSMVHTVHPSNQGETRQAAKKDENHLLYSDVQYLTYYGV